jgi:Fe-S-cluster containining protein
VPLVDRGQAHPGYEASELTTQTVHHECIRCGTCCEKGGPSFHLDDRHLIDNGHIHTRHLYTIRKGEMVHDNVRGLIKPCTGELIKIKGVKGSWQCSFFQKEKRTCGIYEHRPQECRVLKCWDPAALTAMYDQNRLTRQELLSGIEGLWDLVATHEKQCGYAELKQCLEGLGDRPAPEQVKAVLSMVRYDREIRGLVVAKGGVAPDMLDFLFGRPLENAIEMFGYRVRERDGNHALVRM